MIMQKRRSVFNGQLHHSQGIQSMKRIILLTIVCLTPLCAQYSGKIAGRVVDSKTKDPLPMANIVIRGTTYGAASDIDGNYFILNLPPGTYDLTASIVGYRSVTEKGVIVNTNRTTIINFSLDETTLQAAEVVITATRPAKSDAARKF
jgi:hypothetical protein